MSKSYYEVVFEGHYKAIYGLLEGFLMGKGEAWTYFFSKKAGIKTETMAEIILEWVTLKARLHHVIMEKDFFDSFSGAVAKYGDSKFVNLKYIKSSKEIKEATFEFEATTYGKKYGNEIKAVLKNLPEGLQLHDYNPIEKDSEEGKGLELYAPEHHYVFEATGRLAGDVKELVDFRKKLDDHPLIEVKDISVKV